MKSSPLPTVGELTALAEEREVEEPIVVREKIIHRRECPLSSVVADMSLHAT